MDSSHFSSGGINREGEMYTTTPFHITCYRVLIRYLRGLITKNLPCLIDSFLRFFVPGLCGLLAY